MFVSNKIEVRKKGDGEKGIFAKEDIKKGETILEFEKNFVEAPTKTSIQIDEKLHQESRNQEAEENFINHSCNPNAYINFSNLTLVALRNIKKGEEITFNYLTTEHELAHPFCVTANQKIVTSILKVSNISH